MNEDYYNMILCENLHRLFGIQGSFGDTLKIDFIVKDNISARVEVCASVSDTDVEKHLKK